MNSAYIRHNPSKTINKSTTINTVYTMQENLIYNNRISKHQTQRLSLKSSQHKKIELTSNTKNKPGTVKLCSQLTLFQRHKTNAQDLADSLFDKVQPSFFLS